MSSPAANVSEILNQLILNVDERDGRIVSGPYTIIGSNTRFLPCQLILATRCLLLTEKFEKLVLEAEETLKKNPSMDPEAACVFVLGTEAIQLMYHNILQQNNTAIHDYVKNCQVYANSKGLTIVVYTNPHRDEKSEQYSGYGALCWMQILQSVPRDNIMDIASQMLERSPYIMSETELEQCARQTTHEYVSKLFKESKANSLEALRKEVGL